MDKLVTPVNSKAPTREAQAIKPPRLQLQIVDPKLQHSPEFMLVDLALSGLTPEDVHAEQLYGFLVGYKLPYFTLDGAIHPKMHRIRFRDAEKKYDGPSREKIGDDCTHPYIPRQIHAMDCSTICICEGEKKTAAVVKHLDIPAIGIGGSGNWRAGKKQTAIHPVILALLKLRQVKHVLLIPDGDVKRYDIAVEYGTFTSQLRHEHYEVELLHPPGKIDDLILEWGENARGAFAALPRIDSLVENVNLLAERYGLGHKKNADGKVVLAQNISNVLMLLEQHPSFPHIWYNEDTAAIMFDEQPTQMDLHGVNILRFLQHNLQLPNIDLTSVRRALTNHAYKDTRSPFREWLEKLEWDGTPRLEEFFIKYCGSPDTPFNREAGAKWLPGAVWRTMEPGCQVDYMVITQGPQGKGKSTLPDLLWGIDNVKTVLGKESQQKDDLSKYHMGKCVSFEEFDTMYTTNIGHLKGVITNRVDTFRKPYDVDNKSYRRSCVFYASTNKSIFLKRDDTGYRRFVVIRLEQLDFAGVIADRDQLWAEAVAVYRNHNEAGTLFELSEVNGTSTEAKRHVNEEDYISAWDDFVGQLLCGDSSFKEQRHDGYIWLKSEQVWRAVGWGDKRTSQEEKRALKEYMQSNGWEYFEGWKRGLFVVGGKEVSRLERVWVLKAS
jgi:hypothetical protein